MGDLEEIEAIAARKKAEKEREQAEKARSHRERQEGNERALQDLRRRVFILGREVRSKLRIYVSPLHNGSLGSAYFTVSISSAPLWFRRPFATYAIEASNGEGGFTARLLSPDDESRPASVPSELLPHGAYAANGDEIISMLKAASAGFLASKSSFEFELPGWYFVIGAVIGWPLAGLVWLFTGLVAGIPGWLLGWIPGWIALAIARQGWLPIIAALAFLLRDSL